MASTPLATVFSKKETCAISQPTSTRYRSFGSSSTNSRVFIDVGRARTDSRGLQLQPEATALPQRGICAYRAVQPFGRFLDDGQAHARAGGVACIRKADERFEYPVDLLRWNPDAVVLYAQHGFAAFRFSGNSYFRLPVGRRVGQGVSHEVGQDLLEQALIRHYARPLRTEVNMRAAVLDLPRHRAQHRLDGLSGVHRRQRNRFVRQPTVLQQIANQLVAAGRGIADAVQVVARLVIEPVRVLQQQQLRKALHVPIGGAEVVSNGVEQLFHGREARLQLRRALLNLCLEELVDAFFVVDIRAGAEPFYDATFGVAQRHAPRLEPARRAVGAAHTIFDVERRASLDGPLPLGRRPLAIIGINLREPAEPELFLLRNAGVANPLRAQVIAAPVGQARPDQLRQAFGQRAEARLVL